MALGGVALILTVALADFDIWQTADDPALAPPPVPDDTPGTKASLDSIAHDSTLRIAEATAIASKADIAGTSPPPVRPRITARDSAAIAARRERISAAIQELRIRDVMIPIPGLTPDRLRDSFNQSRSNGARRHNAIDMLAPRGTPILAADSGTVLKMNRSTLGGISVYTSDPHGRYVYYYAHLDAYHPSIAEGMSIARGDTLGFVGSTGNAPPTGPHLHFAIYRTDDAERWFNGTPINPREVFRSQ